MANAFGRSLGRLTVGGGLLSDPLDVAVEEERARRQEAEDETARIQAEAEGRSGAQAALLARTRPGPTDIPLRVESIEAQAATVPAPRTGMTPSSRTTSYLPGTIGQPDETGFRGGMASFARDFRPEAEKVASLRAGQFSSSRRPFAQAASDVETKRSQYEEAQRTGDEREMARTGRALASATEDAFSGWERARSRIFGPAMDIVPFDPLQSEAESLLKQAGIEQAGVLRKDPFARERIASRSGEALDVARVGPEASESERGEYMDLLSRGDEGFRSAVSRILASNLSQQEKAKQIQDARAAKMEWERRLQLVFNRRGGSDMASLLNAPISTP